MLRILTVAALLAALCAGALLAFLNQTSVSFHYVLGQWQMPLFVLLLLSFICGALLTLLLVALRMLGMGGQIRQLRRQLRDNEAELRNLRNLPLKDAGTQV